MSSVYILRWSSLLKITEDSEWNAVWGLGGTEEPAFKERRASGE